MDEPRFNQAELSELLKRAAELEVTSDRQAAHTVGLRELQQIASEAGIDPKSVLAAVGEASRKPSHPAVFEWDTVLPRQLSDAAVERALAQVYATVGELGMVHHVVGSPGWHWTNGDSLSVSIVADAGASHVKIASDRRSDRVLLVIASGAAGSLGGMALSLFVGMIAGAPESAVEVFAGGGMLGGVAGGIALGRMWWGRIADRWHSRLRLLSERLIAAGE